MKILLTKNRKINKRRIYVILFMVFVIASLIILDRLLYPIIKDYSKTTAHNIANRTVNTAVNDVLLRNNIKYDDLVKVNIKENQVSSIELNSILINILKSQISDNINDDMYNMSTQKIDIHIGTLFGINMFLNKGPVLNFYVKPYGDVQVKFKHSFTSAGINQTKHQVIMEIDIIMMSYISLFKMTTSFNTNFVMAETIIVGKVPDSYTYVGDVEENLLSKINDYGGNN